MQRFIPRCFAGILRHDTPVEPEHIVASRRYCRERHGRVGTLSEQYERNCGEMTLREACTDGCGDVLEWRKGELGEVVRGKFSCP